MPIKREPKFRCAARCLSAIFVVVGALPAQQAVPSAGLTLSQAVEVTPPQPSRWAQIFDVMAARVPQAVDGESYAIQEQRKFLAFAKRMDGHRDVEAGYLKDVQRLIGRPVKDWVEADAALEQFVLSAGPEHDDALITLFHRWAVTQAKTFLPGLAHLPMFDSSWPRFSKILA